MAVDVDTAASTFRLTGTPRPLFATGISAPNRSGDAFAYAISPDGQRFLTAAATAPDAAAQRAPLTVVLNWQAALAAREKR